MNPSLPEGKILVQFDGMCILCSRTIQFILKADRKGKFLFQTLQNISENELLDTVIVSDQNIKYQYFDAVFKIGSELGGIYRIVAIFRLIPRKWRHSLYLWVARNRFSWFDVRQSCYMPSEEEKKRFI
ncbi:MAG TPA: DCC1-like thiol-disulfide oxidoreductase family protein [Prolixibacteraceae bacterium]|nr:DCC1-like thiol-disulfide oxidoreductase family protein [Prolixibacteraceae bacterium]